MVTMLILVAVALGAALLRGGSLESLAKTSFRRNPLLFAGLGLQVGAGFWSPEWLTGGAALSVVLASNALVAAWLLFNLRLPGLALALGGLLLNVTVISLNGAMPVSQGAIADARVENSLQDAGLKHEPMNDATALGFLGDVLVVPYLREILSIGDVLLALGIAYLAYRCAEPRARRKLWSPRD
jgi:hypothetical protein